MSKVSDKRITIFWCEKVDFELFSIFFCFVHSLDRVILEQSSYSKRKESELVYEQYVADARVRSKFAFRRCVMEKKLVFRATREIVLHTFLVLYFQIIYYSNLRPLVCTC